MAIIRKKTWPEYFEIVASGRKKYDLRLDDFKVEEGDTIIFEEWDPEKKEYTGRTLEKKAGYVGHFKTSNLFWPEEEIKEKGLLVISLD